MPAYKLYSDLAAWWPLLSAPEDYAVEAELYRHILREAGLPPNPALLELGCGGGNNAVHLRPHFTSLTLTDVSAEMLAVSRRLNPDCEHVEGDMRTLRLGRTFEVVFAHDAIAYMNTRDDLARAIATAFAHCKPGGLALFAPDYVLETFRPSTDYGGRDSDGRALRFLEWVLAPELGGSQYTTDYVYMLREAGKPLRVERDQHVLGLFPRGEWLQLLESAGFQPRIVPDEFGRELFLARRPPG